MHVITTEQLRKAVPLCKDPAGWTAHLNDAMLLYCISLDVDYMGEFLTQCAHESQSFNRLEENLNYSAERLMQVWPKRFPTQAMAEKCAHKPHELADYVYDGRMGNTNKYDGWNYRGRGLVMVTGKDNYKLVAKLLNDSNVVPCPDRLTMPSIAAMAAAAWWSSNPKLNALAQDTATDDDYADFLAITRIVNGGKEGLADRAKFRAAFKSVLTG